MLALTSWTKTIYTYMYIYCIYIAYIYIYNYVFIYYFNQGLKKPQSHVGNLGNYTWDKESCLQEMSACNASKSLNYSDMARRFNLRNKQGNFYKYSSGPPEHLRSYLYPGMRSSLGKHFIFSQQYKKW